MNKRTAALIVGIVLLSLAFTAFSTIRTTNNIDTTLLGGYPAFFNPLANFTVIQPSGGLCNAAALPPETFYGWPLYYMTHDPNCGSSKVVYPILLLLNTVFYAVILYFILAIFRRQ